MTKHRTRLQALEADQAAADNGRYEIILTWGSDDVITKRRRRLPPGQDGDALRVIWPDGSDATPGMGGREPDNEPE